MADREKLIELFYENNVRCDQKIEGLADDVMDIIANGVTIQQKPKTNADRIRAMTDEELAKCLYEIGFDCHLCSEHERLSDNPFLRHEKCDEKCVEHCLKWLKQPAEGD